MIKKMLVNGGIMVAGLLVTQAVIEKVEEASLKRNMSKKKNSKKKIEESIKETINFRVEIVNEDGVESYTTVRAVDKDEALTEVLGYLAEGHSVTSIERI